LARKGLFVSRRDKTMNRDELATWLGVRPDMINDNLVEGMAAVRVPSTDREQIDALRRFLIVEGPATADRLRQAREDEAREQRRHDAWGMPDTYGSTFNRGD
jgi:hypothetical protein